MRSIVCLLAGGLDSPDGRQEKPRSLGVPRTIPMQVSFSTMLCGGPCEKRGYGIGAAALLWRAGWGGGSSYMVERAFGWWHKCDPW